MFSESSVYVPVAESCPHVPQFRWLHDFTWANVNTILWDDIKSTDEKLNKNIGKAVVKSDELFDELVIYKKHFEK